MMMQYKEWLDMPQAEYFIEELEESIANAQQSVNAAARRGQREKAAYSAGQLDTLQYVLDSIQEVRDS